MTASVFSALLTLTVLLVYFVIAMRTWLRVRGDRLVVCPETQRPVAITVDVEHAIASAVRETPDLRVTACSRWPERQDCDQPCVRQIETAPVETMPKTIAARFFGQARCAICCRRIHAPSRVGRQPGFMNPASTRVDTWDDVPTEYLPNAIATWRPLCATCTEAEVRRQQSPIA